MKTCINKIFCIFVAIDSDKLEFMKALDLLWGYDNILNKDTLVQKADIAILLARCLNIDLSNYAGEQKFLDVPAEHRAFSAVGHLSDRGIFVGEGKGIFGIESFVNKEDVYRVLASIAGYNLPGGSASITSPKLRNELMNGVVNHFDTRITSFQLVEMLYNFLHLPMVEQKSYGETQNYVISDNTPLQEYFDIYKLSGIVKATGVGALIGEQKTDINSVKIGSSLYDTGNMSVVDYLGCEIDFYYRWTKEMARGSLVYIEVGDCDVLSFDIADGLYADGKYTYYVSDTKKKTAAIPTDAVIVYNGVPTDFNGTIMNPAIGKITLYDTNSDNKYETVHIKEYKVYVVEAVNVNDMVVTFKYTNDVVSVDENEYERLKITDTDGNVLTYKSIKPWNVLMISESFDKKNSDIMICKDSVKGTVSEVETVQGKSFVTIDDIDYEVSSAYVDGVDDIVKLSEGGTFRLDKDGKIVTLVNNSQDGWYAYVMGIAEKTGLGPKKLLKLFTEDENNGSVMIMSLADKVVIDGKKCNSDGISGGIDYIAQNVKIGDIIIYKTNGNDEIKYIDTPNPNYSGAEVLQNVFDTANYTKETLQFETNTFEGFVNVNSNTLVFALPQDKDKEDKYQVTGSSILVPNTYYSFKAYGSDKTNMFADVIVTTATSASEKITSDSEVHVIGDIRIKLNEEGEYAYFIEVPSSTVKSFEVDKDCPRFDTIGKGDLVYLGIDASNVVVDIRLVYDVSEDKFLDCGQREWYGTNVGQVYANGSTGINVTEAYGWAPKWKTVVANPYQYESGFVRLTYDSLEDIMQWTGMSEDVRSYSVSAAEVYSIEKGRRDYEVSVSSLDSIRDYLHYGDQMTKIALQANWGRVQKIFVYR